MKHDTNEGGVDTRLRDSEARFALIFDHAPFAIAVTRWSDGIVVDVNDAFLELFACRRAEILGRSSAELNLAARAEHVAALRAHARIRDQVVHQTTRGKARILSLSHERVRLPCGDHVLTTILDVTERERGIEALRASQAQLQLFIENAPACIAMFDREMRYLWASHAWAEAYRITDFIGRSHYEVFPDIPDARRAVHRRALAGETLQSDGERMVLGDGRVQWLKWRVLPWYAAPGEIGGIMIAVDDITDVMEADRRKDEFIATLAHELRNPLAPLRAGLEVLQRAADPAIGERTRGIMGRQLGHLVRLVDDLLDVARVGRGQFALQRERLRLDEVIGCAVETSQPLIDAAGHVLAVHLPTTPIWLDADLTRMAQAISNLLTNAAKYTPRPGRIELRATTDGDQVVIVVGDDGLGIAPEDLPQVFDMFAQLRVARERAGGIGIGLSLVRKLVELHGGSVVAASAGIGTGTTFTIRVPRAQPPDAVVEPLPATSHASPARARRVLVVDDDVDVAETLATMLELDGCVTAVAHRGSDALALAATFEPSVMLVDLALPDMSGHDVARQLRTHPARAGMVLVALTGWGGPDHAQRSVEAGFDLHFVKPIDAGTLEEVLAGGLPARPRV